MWSTFPRLLLFSLIPFSMNRVHAADSKGLSVQICNFSRADRKMLTQAEAIASGLFRDAGIAIVCFISDNPGRFGKLEPSRLTIQIFPGRSKRTDLKDAFGVAMTDDNSMASFLADIFLGAIEEVATARIDETVLLGYAIAHEAGHLLGEMHAPGTVMAESWSARDIPHMRAGRVRFSAIQAARLRTAVRLRLRIR